MAEPVTASATNPGAVVGMLSDLGAAWFERLSSGDWARASVVLGVFAETFNAHHDAVLAFVRNSSRVASLSLVPARADATFSANTRRALQVVFILDAFSAEVVPLVERMPQVAEPSGITTWWRQYQAYVNQRTSSFITAVSADAVRTLAANLAARVNARITGTAAEVVRDMTTTPFDVPTVLAPRPGTPSSPIPGTTILVTPSRWTMPTWGWWAVGVGALAAGGVVLYGMTERGWFKGAR